jgi:hypothetical protein
MIFGALLLAALAADVVPDFNGTYQQQMAGVRNLPADVRAFIDRRANCNHWSGEEPYDQDRRVQIQSAVKELRCEDLLKDETALQRRYQSNQPVLKALALSQDWSPG